MGCWYIDLTLESDGTSKTTRDKGGRDPPNVTLDEIAKDLFSFFNIKKTEENIKKKYDIKQDEHDFWPEDDIKRAWGKIQRMDRTINSDKRKDWSAVIILQIVKRSCVYGRKGTPEERSSQSNAELEAVGAAEGVQQLSGRKQTTSSPNYAVPPCAGGVELLSGAGLKTRKENVRLEDDHQLTVGMNQACGKAQRMKGNSEDRSSQSSAELETLGAAGGVVRVADVHDKENVRLEGDRRSTVGMNQACGKAQRMKGNSEDRSSQSNAEPSTVEAAGGVKKSSRGNHTTYSAQTYSVNQGQTARDYERWHQITGNPPGAGYGQDRPDVALQNEGIDGPRYIRIPLLLMLQNEQNVAVQQAQQPVPEQGRCYKFINGSPSASIDEDLWKNKSYAMSYNRETSNANWVYEILNSQTLAKKHCRAEDGLGDPYQKGHLAAAANHRWCQEAHNHANFFSNIVPQHKSLNMGLWKKAENRCKDLAEKDGIRNVHVYSGPLYRNHENQWIREKAVPTDLFKVIIVENENGTVREPECYLMPNGDVRPDQSGPQSDQLKQYRRTIEEIEQVSRLSFIHTNVRGNDRTVTMIMQGPDGEEIQQTAAIQVQIKLQDFLENQISA